VVDIPQISLPDAFPVVDIPQESFSGIVSYIEYCKCEFKPVILLQNIIYQMSLRVLRWK
jgi:hypothetical protein